MSTMRITGPVAEGDSEPSDSGGPPKGGGTANDASQDEPAASSATRKRHPKNRRHKHRRGSKHAGQKQRQFFGRVPTLDEIKVMKSQLTVAVGTGGINSKTHNAMLKSLCSLEDSLRKDATEPGSNIVDKTGLQEKLKQDPSLLHLIGPLLSDETLQEMSDDDDENDEDDDEGCETDGDTDDDEDVNETCDP